MAHKSRWFLRVWRGFLLSLGLSCAVLSSHAQETTVDAVKRGEAVVIDVDMPA